MIVVDSNVWISAVLFPGSIPDRALDQILLTGRFAISPDQVAEIEAVLKRPKFRGQIDAHAVARMLQRLQNAPWNVEPTERVTDCRDPKDNMLLEIALASNADTIVSGDADLLALHPWRGRRIVTPRAYLDSV